jgi:hypothetical protein
MDIKVNNPVGESFVVIVYKHPERVPEAGTAILGHAILLQVQHYSNAVDHLTQHQRGGSLTQ